MNAIVHEPAPIIAHVADSSPIKAAVSSPIIMGGGSPEPMLYWDLTSATPLIDEIRGIEAKSYHVTFDSNGGLYSLDTTYIFFPALAHGITIEVDVDYINVTRSKNRRFIMATSDKGLVYRNTGAWGFYNGSWEMSDISDSGYFDNSTVKVVIDKESHWKIYRDNDLIFEPSGTLELNAGNPDTGGSYSTYQRRFFIGSNDGNTINNALFKAVRVY